MKTNTQMLLFTICAALPAASSLAESSPGGAASADAPPPDVVRRFDINVNGKLDPEELAKWKAETEKNAQDKAARAAKKEKDAAEKKKKKKNNGD